MQMSGDNPLINKASVQFPIKTADCSANFERRNPVILNKEAMQSVIKCQCERFSQRL